MNEQEKKAQARLHKGYRRLGTDNPSCVVCGYRGHPDAFERAHIAPNKFHDDWAILCRNCHREQSECEKDKPYEPETQNPQMETIAHYLLGLAKFFELIAQTLIKFGDWLLEQAAHTVPYIPEPTEETD